jgi:hypothetical protein
MTSIEWLAKELESHGDPQYCELEWKTLALLIDQAKEMHKQEVIDAYFEGAYGGDNISGEQYYQETFVSKGSGMSEKPNNHIDRTCTNSCSVVCGECQLPIPQTEISDKSWEGCDGCTEQDEIMYKNGYAKGYNAAIAEPPKEISDEEITKLANEHILYNDSKRQWVIEGMKLYREQLKQ